MKNALKIVSLLAAALILAIAALLVVGIPSGLMNAMLEDRIARDGGVKVTFEGATRVGLFPFHLTVHDVTMTPSGDDKTRVFVERIEAEITLASLLSGEPTASSVTLTRPILRAPLIRERGRGIVPASTAPVPPRRVPLQRLIVNDAAVVLSDPVAKVEQRVDGLFADVQIADSRVTIAGRARLGDAPATFTAKTRLATSSDRQPVPFELTFDAPGVMARGVTAMGDVKFAGALVSLSNLSGRLGDEAFNGWASADLSSKPVLKLDLDFPQLSFDVPQWRENRGSESSWSTKPFDFAGLNYADAQAKLSVAELKIGMLRVIPAALDVTLGAGALKVQASRLGVGGGEIDGDVVIDASGTVPDLSLRADIGNVRARPLLSSLAGFDKIDGRMTAKLVLRGAGANPRALAATVGGTAFVAVKDGEIVGVNLAQMIRSLTASTLTGWQETSSETTDLSQLSASFRLERGQGTTTDLMLAGPLVRMTGAGNIDLVSETMAFRVEPKLVMTLQGQSAPGATSAAPTPVGLGVPVIVQGPWTSPRIYPEISGMLENPEAAYIQLRQMGQGLFGRDLLGKDLQGLIGPSGGAGQDGIGQAIGNIIQGLGAGQKPTGVPPTAAPDDRAPPPAAADPNAPSPMNDIMKRLFSR
jgi:AsmA protein